MKTEIEIERKYVIMMPTEEELAASDSHTSSRITQIYLDAEKGTTHRVRRREWESGTVYYETVKQRIDAISVVETEGEITEERYLDLAANPARGTRPIVKVRHTFSYLGQLFEVDIYPEWQKSCILETELSSRTERAQLPDFIKVVREVTGERAYSNHSMSHSFPPELV